MSVETELNKIYAQRTFQSTGTNSEKPEVNSYDDKIVFNIENRTVDSGAYQDVIVQNDNNSRTISFRMQRFFEDVDLSLKGANIRYTTPSGESDETFSSNRTVSADYIAFDWIISEKATAASGELQFDVLFYDDDGYSWHTKPAILLVEKGLTVTTISPKPSQDWIDSWRAEAGKILTICIDSAEKAIQIEGNVSVILDATKSSMEYSQKAEKASSNAMISAESALESKNIALQEVAKFEREMSEINAHLGDENIHLKLGEREGLNASLLDTQKYAETIEAGYKASDLNLIDKYKLADKAVEDGYLLADEVLANNIEQTKLDYVSADSKLEVTLRSADTEILNQAIANADYIASLKATTAKNEAISKASQDASDKAYLAEINAKATSVPIESKGIAGGVAELDESGKVITTQLPQIVHDAYEHSQITKGNPHGWAKEDFDLDKVPNVPTNFQTPTFTEASTPTKLLSGETLTSAFGKIASAITFLLSHIADTVIHITASERIKWNDKYTKSEVDNKFSAFENNIDWKEAVETFADIAMTYPNPQNGWTVNVNENNYTYRYNSNGIWEPISANAIPKATKTLDGLMSKEKILEVESSTAAKHTHGNKALLDSYTQAEVNIKSAIDQRHNHSNKNVLDGITAALISTWNTVGNKVDKITGKGLSSNDYTTAEKDKLAGVAIGANKYVLPLAQATGISTTNVMSQKAVTDAIVGVETSGMSKLIYDTNNNGIVDNAEKVNGLTVLTAVPSGAKFTDTTYGVATTTVNGLMVSTDKSKLDGITSGANKYIHPSTTGNKHIPSGGVSGQFLKWSADGTAIWAADNNTTYGVATTTANGLMASADKTKLNGVETGANKYVHPSAHPASMITGLPTSLPASDVYAWAKASSKPSYTKSEIGLGNAENTADSAKNVLSATKLTTARTINGVSFNGTGNITITAAANGGTANYLNANSVGASTNLNNLTSPGFYYCAANATVATMTNTPSKNAFFMIVGKHAGTFQMFIEYMTANPKVFIRNYYGSWGGWQRIYHSADKPTLSELGAAASGHTHPAQTTITGNAGTATKLQTGRKINGVLFDGSTDITVADSTKEPKFTKNNAFNKNFGTAAGTVCQGNDARLSNARPANGGNAATATKLQTARTINGVAFDGTRNIVLPATPSAKTYSATIGTAWSAAAPFTQSVTVTGILATDTPIVDVVLSSTSATALSQIEAWGMVDKIVTSANQITVTCFAEKPSTAIPIQLKVVN